jgi:hypothetical protein
MLPAFCVDVSACARSDLVFGARVERMRAGRTRKSLFPLIVPVQGVQR